MPKGDLAMNNNITILMLVYNECEYAQLALQDIRMFANEENISVIVADNGSTDDTADYMEQQSDITYVRMEKGPLPAGRVVNAVLNQFCLEGDLLILNPSCMLMPGCTSKLQKTLHQEESTAIVGAMTNSARKYQKNSQFTDYGDAVQNAHTLKEGSRRSLSLETGAVLIKNSTIRAIGLFDERLLGLQYVLTDYCLRIILSGKNVRVCDDAFVWDAKYREHTLTDEQDDVVIEQKWGMHYFNMSGNSFLADQIARSPSEEFNVLEVGCDCGATLLEIKDRYPNAHVYGSELNEKAVRFASCVAEVCVNNIEEQNLPFDSVKFDYIIFGDVLEHLRDPLSVVRYCRGLLSQDGQIIASIPNVMHISVIEGLFNGRFTYTETGLLDKTHIHFFTYNEIIKMFTEARFEILEVTYLVDYISESQKVLTDRLCNLGLESQRSMFEAFQYITKARKKGG
jgi:2-polyprenyl-3-methyl-5-hydroxy-6-metoxy-1,4-benzoquinol methylase